MREVAPWRHGLLHPLADTMHDMTKRVDLPAFATRQEDRLVEKIIMSDRFFELANRLFDATGRGAAGLVRAGSRTADRLHRHRRSVIALAVAGALGYGLVAHPPIEMIERGEVGLRINRLTGEVSEAAEGAVVVLPAVHELRRYSLREQVYRPAEGQSASGESPFQSVEGLSIGVDVSIRYVLDASRLTQTARALPADIDREVVEPVVQSVLYKTFAAHTVREIFSTQRRPIQQAIEAELKPLLARDGVVLQGVMIGKIDLPQDYKAGMERLLAEELASEKMRYTLELKDKQVKQTELEGQAEKVRREKSAEAAAQEQIIAAQAQAEAMKHVLPFKQKQIEQRALEAEAAKVTRIKAAEANAAAQLVEAQGEADSRRKLADAEAYRQDQLGKLASEQLARDGAHIDRHPLLIQKTLADKLSDKISVIIAPASTDGRFIGANLLGNGAAGREGE